MVKAFSLLTWLIGNLLAVKGFTITGIAFELISKVSSRKQYLIAREN
ncbi:MAG: hypothetical protein HY755_10095 [Nitrospirae bacterium]|nr:hypothetical protein [Nitrospirota bacterium]